MIYQPILADSLKNDVAEVAEMAEKRVLKDNLC